MIKVLDFYASWCGPCKMVSKVLDEITSDEIIISKIDVEENDEMADDYEIRSVPTLIFLKDDQIVKKHIGNISKDKLLKLIDDIK